LVAVFFNWKVLGDSYILYLSIVVYREHEQYAVCGVVFAVELSLAPPALYVGL
jgi:hypothetical protein